MGDVIHATRHAIEIVRTRKPHPEQDPDTSMTAACDDSNLAGLPHHMYFGNPDARLILGLDDFRPKGFVPSPTCPVCRVLLDAALEQRDVAKLMKAVASE